MQLSQMTEESLILTDVGARDKSEALRRLVQGIHSVYGELDENELFSVILDRERLNSTGIGSGIAIPHAKHPDCRRHIVAFGRSRVGVPFDAIDGKPVHLIFMIVGPVGANEIHLRTLARISKFLHDTTFRDRLMTAETAREIFEAVLEKDRQG